MLYQASITGPQCHPPTGVNTASGVASRYLAFTPEESVGHLRVACTFAGVATALGRRVCRGRLRDQRQRVLRITGAGMKLWEELPDPLVLIREIAFDGSDAAELATAFRVLQAATQRLNDHLAGASKHLAEDSKS